MLRNPCWDRREGRLRESCDPLHFDKLSAAPVLAPRRGRRIESLDETRDNQFRFRNAAGVSARKAGVPAPLVGGGRRGLGLSVRDNAFKGEV